MSTKEKRAIGVIMDGNRRFAEEQGVSLRDAYIAGGKKLREVISWAREEGYTDVLAFAFSADNWKRNAATLEPIFDILKSAEEMYKVLTEVGEELVGSEEEASAMAQKEGVRVRFVGDIHLFPKEIIDNMRKIEEKTKDAMGVCVWLFVSYNGRADIVQAAKKNISEGKELSRENISSALGTASVPDPDCIIRTGRARRLSSFLLWEAEYAEIFFVDTLWPTFSKEQFDTVMQQLAQVERKFGL